MKSVSSTNLSIFVSRHHMLGKKAVAQELDFIRLMISLAAAFFVVIAIAYILSFVYRSLL